MVGMCLKDKLRTEKGASFELEHTRITVEETVIRVEEETVIRVEEETVIRVEETVIRVEEETVIRVEETVIRVEETVVRVEARRIDS
jgi:transposase-like protein